MVLSKKLECSILKIDYDWIWILLSINFKIRLDIGLSITYMFLDWIDNKK
jgi:hypothetical protein